MRNFDDLSGKQFGIWKVLKYDHTKSYRYAKGDVHGISHYLCQCVCCGRTFVVSRPNLLNHKNVRHNGICWKGGESK